MAISDKLEYLNDTKGLLKDKINNLGGSITDETTFREYAEELQTIYENAPKTSYGEGTEITLSPTLKGKLDFEDDKVGYGDTKQATIPNEYQAVKWIQFSSAYSNFNKFDTGIVNDDYDYETECEIIVATTSQDTPIIATYNTSGNSFQYYSITPYQNTFRVGANGSEIDTQYPYSYNLGDKIKVEFNKNKRVYINGTDIYEQDLNIRSYNGEGTITLGWRGTVSERQSTYKFLYSKIYHNNELISYLIPCYRKSDSVKGMYDIIRNIFITPSTQAYCSVGTDESLPSPDLPIDIQSATNNQEIVVQNKNLFDTSNLKIGNIDTTTGQEQLSYYYGITADYIKAKPNTTYSVQYSYPYDETIRGQIVIYEYDNNKNFIRFSNNNAKTFSKLLGSSTQYIKLRFEGASNHNNAVDDYDDIQLEENSTVTTYVEHAEETYTINLGNIELCKIGNYQDYIYKSGGNWYKKEYIGKVVFNGSSSENWAYEQNNNGFVIMNKFYDLMGIENYNTEKVPDIFCNQYKPINYANYLNGIMGANIFYYRGGNFFRCKSTLTTAEAFKTYLSEHNIVVYYIKATPQDIELTDTSLINQLEAIYNANSYNGTTIITSSGSLPMKLKVRALKGE